ncbi:uncharacterized protein LOC131686252 isoform X2 [Topomyia yanbarensis]|uniref:uncharacterized protein LOC131682694 n=1 Tax=Topomyia yanbarensis TaxID=2498891 RepID=UPI00273B7EB9|nr:uncharacterized protein LOC131682694 [Topomyia yanbarensis]XP_058826500.1 uncharacterized protein LOC131686252 isoform X2 [Topomyia yanbarensis]
MNTSKLIRICNSSRKKTFVKIIPTVANLFQKAQHFFNEEYARIVLEEDGSSIMENDVVDACADGGLVLMLLKKDESWTPFESSIDAASKASTFVYDDIQYLEETSSDLINKLHPTIVIVGSTRQSYYIHAQNSRVSENFESFILAIQHLVMVYFVYYFSYPSNLSKTLEFLQLYFYKLNPFKGSRSKATLVGQQQRLVRALMLKIAKFKSTV